MNFLFNPAVALVNRLNYSKKLMLIGFIATLVVVALIFQLFTQSLASITFSKSELYGVEYINPLIDVMKDIQQYRKLESDYLLGDLSVKDALQKAQNTVDYAIKQSDTKEIMLGTTLKTSNAWNSIKNEWNLIKADIARNQDKSHFIATSAMIGNIQSLIITACDNSNLTLDPDIDTYYSMDTYCTKLPSFIEEAALIRELGAVVISTKILSPETREQLIIIKTLMDKFNKVGIKGNFEKILSVRPALAPLFDPLLQKIITESTDLTYLLDHTLLGNNYNVTATIFSEKYTDLINVSYSLYEETAKELKIMIQQRVSNITHTLYLNYIISITGLLLLLYLFIGMYLSISRSIKSLIKGSEQLAKGDLTAKVELETHDELVRVASSFNTMRTTLTKIINESIHILENISKGNLTEKMAQDYQGSFDKLKSCVNMTVESLEKLIKDITIATDTINLAAKDIALGNNDLEKRTQQQAAFLEETAASIEQVTATVKQNAENAKQANHLAQSSSDAAIRGGKVVGDVIATMTAINDSSSKVADIISVIDEIAFQTKILALNAAVEAARAGEQGKGFAVVATEVRNLAQRTSAAAKEIKDLISKSVMNVAGGTKQVDQAGQTMEEIVKSVNHVTEIMAEITSASIEQSTGIEQVNKAVVEMDHVTQLNMTLVEEAANASKSMENQTAHMEDLVSVFKFSQKLDNENGTSVTQKPYKDNQYEIQNTKNSKRLKYDQSLKDKNNVWNEF